MESILLAAFILLLNYKAPLQMLQSFQIAVPGTVVHAGNTSTEGAEAGGPP